MCIVCTPMPTYMPKYLITYTLGKVHSTSLKSEMFCKWKIVHSSTWFVITYWWQKCQLVFTSVKELSIFTKMGKVIALTQTQCTYIKDIKP